MKDSTYARERRLSFQAIRLLIFLSLALLTTCAMGQRPTQPIELKTPDGRTVLLKPDGTWEYKNETPAPRPTPLVTTPASSPETLSPNFSGDDRTTLLHQLVEMKKRLVKSEFETSAAYETRVAEEKKKPILGGRNVEESFYLVSSAVKAEYNADTQTMSFSLPVRRNVVAELSRGRGRFGKNIGHHILIDAQGDTKRFAIVFNNERVVGFQGDYMKPASEFFERSIVNFDSALAEFQQLTASVRPEPEEEEETIEDDPAEITDKYDRFKNITIVGTSRMALRGDKRSIRIRAEYSFNGKTPVKPEKVFLYFFASSARPLFREDDLQLNFLVDGERLPAGTMRISDEEKTKSTIRQVIMIDLSFETFSRIANAKTVELQIGNLEYKFTDTHLDAFKKLLSGQLKNK